MPCLTKQMSYWAFVDWTFILITMLDLEAMAHGWRSVEVLWFQLISQNPPPAASLLFSSFTQGNRSIKTKQNSSAQQIKISPGILKLESSVMKYRQDTWLFWKWFRREPRGLNRDSRMYPKKRTSKGWISVFFCTNMRGLKMSFDTVKKTVMQTDPSCKI